MRRMTGTTDGIIGWRWLDTRLRRRAYRKVRGGPAPSRLRRFATAAIAAAVQVGSFAMLLTGAWLCTLRFPGVALLPGAVLLFIGALILPKPAALPRAPSPPTAPSCPRCRPWPTGSPPRWAYPARNHRAGRPVRRRLGLRRVAAAPVPAHRRPALGGARPGAGTALVALELARFGGGDPSRSALTGTVERSLATMVAMFEPARARRLHERRDDDVTKMMAAKPGLPVGTERRPPTFSRSSSGRSRRSCRASSVWCGSAT